ncbi:MAG: hypothetical protein ABW212_04290 [Pseudonocardia sediminis]
MLSDVGTGGLTLVADLLVPVGALLTVVTSTGTVQWLKGKRRLALLAPLSVVSVIGIVGVTRVAKPGSPWARYRYDDDRMGQARARFGGPVAPSRPSRAGPTPLATAGFATLLVGVVAGVPLGAATSFVGGVLMAHALLARAGRQTSRLVCTVVIGVAALAEAMLVAIDLPARGTLPGAVTTLVVAAGVGMSWLPSARSVDVDDAASITEDAGS